MFSALKRKYTRLLLSAVSIIFISYSIVVFFLYWNLLETDYKDKLSYFGKQQTSNAKQSLMSIENNMQTFFSELDITKGDIFAQIKISNGLKKFKSINLDILALYFSSPVTTETLLLNEEHQVRYDDFLLMQYWELFHTPSDKIQWYYLKYEDYSKDCLLCLQSVSFFDTEDYYTLGVVIPVDVVLPTITTISDDSNIFSNLLVSASILPDSDAILYMDEAEAEQPSSSDKHFVENFSSRIGTLPFSLYLQFSKESLNRMLFFFFLGIVTICIILFLSAYITQKFFVRKMIQAFQALSNQFSIFLDNEDNITI